MRWCRRLISVRMSTRSLASRLDSGSSNRKTCGLRTSARPMATRWRWPPESWLGLRSSRWPICSVSATSATALSRSGFGTPRISMPKAMFCATVMFGIERVGLEHHGDVALRRMQVVDRAAVDADLARGDRLQPGDGVEQRGLAAARRADQHEEAALLDLEVDALQDRRRRRSVLCRLLDLEEGHGLHPFTAPAIRPRTK